MNRTPIIVWFRRDLRLTDNPALFEAASTGRPVVPVYIHDDSGDWRPGGASRWWLHHSLAALREDLQRRGAPLVLRRGESINVLSRLVRETGADAVYWNRQYDQGSVARDTTVKSSIGVEAKSFNASLLCEPWDLKTGAGTPFRVFTPFFRALSASLRNVDIAPAPAGLEGFGLVDSDELGAWGLTPAKPNWAKHFPNVWQPGEMGAQRQLTAFLQHTVDRYAVERDRPDIAGTSRLSPHLHFGEIGPRQVWRAAATLGDSAGVDKFKSELAWREFSYHLIFHTPGLPDTNLRREFDAFPWRSCDEDFTAWTQGRTGMPIVDAGMRELWATGWMHNRVRMIVASFLVKNLMIDWRCGARWFWDTLVDADLANNSASWQWVAGCGADAAPFFRIFNPVLQGRKFDPHGEYVRKWVPELGGVAHEDVHAPWLAPASKLAAANVELGRTYPFPIADLAATRDRALAAFSKLKSAA